MANKIAPDEAGRILLRRSDAAWLARVSTETIRRWTDVEKSLALIGAGRAARVEWHAMRERLRADGRALAHWSWLEADLSQPIARSVTALDAVHGSNDHSDIQELQAEIAELRHQRDQAVADAENLDQAVMSYRDNWRRRVEPWSAGSVEDL